MDALLAPLLPLLSSARLALEPLGLEIDKLEALIFTHTDPAGTTRLLTEGWWLADLRSAVYIAIAYLLFVLAGSLLWRLPFVPRVDPYPLKFAYDPPPPPPQPGQACNAAPPSAPAQLTPPPPPRRRAATTCRR
jgi:hypothetical protein